MSEIVQALLASSGFWVLATGALVLTLAFRFLTLRDKATERRDHSRHLLQLYAVFAARCQAALRANSRVAVAAGRSAVTTVDDVPDRSLVDQQASALERLDQAWFELHTNETNEGLRREIRDLERLVTASADGEDFADSAESWRQNANLTLKQLDTQVRMLLDHAREAHTME